MPKENGSLVYHDISSLKEGDEVCIEEKAMYGWLTFRRRRYPKKIVARITPAKRKVIMTDGTEYDHRQLFVYPCEQTEQSTKISGLLLMVSRKLFHLNGTETLKLIDAMPDEKVEAFCNLINQAYDIYNIHERNISK